MTTKAQRGILWGALFLFAFLGGSFLGRFVVQGLAGGGKMLGDNAAANFWAEQDRARNSGATAAANMAVARGGSGAHVCEGCDASNLRTRQTGNQAFHYDAAPTDSAGDGATAPPAPPPSRQ